MKQYNYIYLITNQVNNKIYVGKHSTNNLDDGYMGSGILIKKAITKYGIENFTKEYLAFCDTEEKLNWFEKFYIKKYKAREVGYNLTDGGDGSLGRKHTEETKQKMRDNHADFKGEKHPMYGRHLSEEHKAKLKQSLTEETKQKMRESALKRPPFSEESKQKMREAALKREKRPPFSEESKQKMRESALKREAAKRQKNKENNL